MQIASWPDPVPSGLAVYNWTLDLHVDHAEDWNLLAPGERFRAARYRHDVDRRRYVQTRAGVRRIFGDILSRRPEEVPITVGLHGKPDVALDIAPLFNVSHAGTQALAALGDACVISHVGIDIEVCKPGLDVQAVMDLALTDAELHEFAHVADSQEAMYRRWVQKEAVLKAIGVGIAVHLKTVGVYANPDGALEVRSSRPEWTQFNVIALTAPAGYAAALAWKGRGTT